MALFSVFSKCVCILLSNNYFPCVQTKFGKYMILGDNTQFFSLEYPNRKFGVGRSMITVEQEYVAYLDDQLIYFAMCSWMNKSSEIHVGNKKESCKFSSLILPRLAFDLFNGSVPQRLTQFFFRFLYFCMHQHLSFQMPKHNETVWCIVL